MSQLEWIGDFVDKARFTELFVEVLGWDRPRERRSVQVETDLGEVSVTEVASFRGLSVWACPCIPSSASQRQIDRILRSESAERVVIFYDDMRQLWRWPQARDAAGSGAPRLVSHEHIVGRTNEALRQRLQFISLGMDEDVTVLEVVRRLRKAFDSDRITKSFYVKFAAQHSNLTSQIQGISVSDAETKPELRWYGSILLNRLMFIYFMQRKGFLDGDPDYLRNRLERVRSMDRPENFFAFYSDFLIPLFHEGLGADASSRKIDDPVIRDLIGDIPYVNGGIFARHPLEETNEIQVPDAAFEEIFDFFDQWQWHLDDRPSGNPNEINPDVLGYIFEQFVNNREEAARGNKAAATNADKGAYYTKEDVTGFMTDNALIPVFLERLQEETGVNPWRPLSIDPDRYIWTSLRHGADVPFPEEVAAADDEFPRPSWDSTPVPSEIGLPTESWWEVNDRLSTYRAIESSARRGELSSGDAVVRANLDLETLAVDVIDSIDSPGDVLQAWGVLTELRVIDPTCGSGAFLFSALNALHLLYSAVLDAADEHYRTSGSRELGELLASAEAHPNRDYFLLKHAALNNIFGVDLMPEAVEIARLRLFLKLIAQVERREDIQPLPDLEFNVQAGNLLVGATSIDEILDRVDLFNYESARQLVEQSHATTQLFARFAAIQAGGSHAEVVAAKSAVREATESLRDQLDSWWFEASDEEHDLTHYKVETRPFHWLVEFPQPLSDGGFDVVLGNPPYVPRNEIDYTIDDLETRESSDIYAPCVERSMRLLREGGRLAMITPHSLMQSRNFAALRTWLRKSASSLFCSSFARIPAGLFENDVRVRNTIVLARRSYLGTPTVHSSRCRRWYTEFRPHLMALIRYAEIPSESETWPFVDDPLVLAAFGRLKSLTGGLIGDQTVKVDPTDGDRTLFFKSNAYNYLSVSLEPVPVINKDGSVGQTSAQRELAFSSKDARDFSYAILAGRLGFLWWALNGDDFNLTSGVLEGCPGGFASSPKHIVQEVLAAAPKIMKAQRQATVWKMNLGKKVGNWDLSACRPVTDVSDLALLRASGCTVDEMQALWTLYHRVYMGGTD